MCNPKRLQELNCFVCLIIALCFLVFGLFVWVFVLTIDFHQLENNNSAATTLTTTLSTLATPTTPPAVTLGFDLQPLQVVDDGAEKLHAAASLRANLLRAKAQQQQKKKVLQEDDSVTSSENSDSVLFSSSSDSSFEFDVPIEVDGGNDVSSDTADSSFVFDVSLEASSSSVSTAEDDDPTSDEGSVTNSETSDDSSSAPQQSSSSAATTTVKTTTKAPAPTEAFAKPQQNILLARGTIITTPKAAATRPTVDKKAPAKPVVAANNAKEPAKVLSMAERLRIQKANKG